MKKDDALPMIAYQYTLVVTESTTTSIGNEATFIVQSCRVASISDKTLASRILLLPKSAYDGVKRWTEPHDKLDGAFVHGTSSAFKEVEGPFL